MKNETSAMYHFPSARRGSVAVHLRLMQGRGGVPRRRLAEPCGTRSHAETDGRLTLIIDNAIRGHALRGHEGQRQHLRPVAALLRG